MASVDGLVTGMSTTDTINQLMKIEAQPQTVLKSKITTANKVVAAYQSINSRLSSIATAAKALGSSDTWAGMKATASSPAAAVSAKAGAAAGSLSFQVKSLATTQVMTFTDAPVASGKVSVALTDPDTGKPIIKLEDPGNPGVVLRTLNPADDSMQSVAAAINAETDLPYKAAVVQIGENKYTLQLTAKASGEKAGLDMAAAGVPSGLTLGVAETTVAGANAEIKVGSTNPYSIESATNTFADILPGVTVTAAKVQEDGETVTVDVSSDVEGIAAKVQALVDNANVALSEIAAQSKIKSGDAAAGALVGDSAIRKITQDIIGAIAGGAAGLGVDGRDASFSQVGVSVDRSGKLTFKKQAFLDSYAADPAKTQQLFDAHQDKAGGTAGTFQPGFDTAIGLGRKLEALALVASEGVADPTDSKRPKQGTMQNLIKRNTETIKGLNTQVDQWDVRLELRKTALQKQFSSLEVALGKMQQQSSWLAGQLAGLG